MNLMSAFYSSGDISTSEDLNHPSCTLVIKMACLSFEGQAIYLYLNFLLPKTIIRQPIFNIHFEKILNRHQCILIFTINLFQGISHNLHSFGRHLAKGGTAWP